jgi:uroporphyrinogen decarboxylase
MNDRFKNACNRVEQPTPPIWMMRQAGRYQQDYMQIKETHTFEQMCKLPQLASKVALLPIQQFDFDIAILFSDILFPIEGLGVPLKFSPGPTFEYFINQENYKEHCDVKRAIKHMEFQARAVKITREKLHPKKSLIGFVGGPWTLLNYATGGQKLDLSWKADYLEQVIVPLLRQNIYLQLDAGAEKVMILDSGVDNMSEAFFKTKYVKILKPLIDSKTAYYTKRLNQRCLPTLYKMGWSGLGVDSTVSMSHICKKYKDGFIQGNFDEQLMLLPWQECKTHIENFCNEMQAIDRTGWVCGLGHGIIKETPEDNVKMFVDIIRERFS